MVMLRLIFLARAGIRNIAGAYRVGHKALAKVPSERGGLNNVTVYLKPYGANLLVH